MKPRVKATLCVATAATAVLLLWLFAGRSADVSQEKETSACVTPPSTPPAAHAAGSAPAAAEPPSEPESPQDEEERLVDAFDGEVDKWMEPSSAEIPVERISAFLKMFDALPKERKEECLQRALNLVPDENAVLLAALLFDPETSREHKELVFNDILNRNEDVKEPILKRVFKDKKHPCWADAAWILDVTAETPAGQP